MRENKQTYYQTLFAKYAGDCKNTWKMISSVLNRKNKKQDLPQFFVSDDILYYEKNAEGKKVERITNIKLTDEKTIADQFNVFFSQIGEKLANSIINPGTKKISTYLTKNITCSLELHKITTEEVSNTIKGLITKK